MTCPSYICSSCQILATSLSYDATQPYDYSILYYATTEGFASIPIHSKLFPAYVVEAAVIVNTCGREWSFPLTVALRSSVKRPKAVADGGPAPNGSSRQSSQVQPRARIGKPFVDDRPDVQRFRLSTELYTLHYILHMDLSCE